MYYPYIPYEDEKVNTCHLASTMQPSLQAVIAVQPPHSTCPSMIWEKHNPYNLPMTCRTQPRSGPAKSHSFHPLSLPWEGVMWWCFRKQIILLINTRKNSIRLCNPQSTSRRPRDLHKLFLSHRYWRLVCNDKRTVPSTRTTLLDRNNDRVSGFAVPPLCTEKKKPSAEVVFLLLVFQSLQGWVKRVETEEFEINRISSFKNDDTSSRWPGINRCLGVVECCAYGAIIWVCWATNIFIARCFHLRAGSWWWKWPRKCVPNIFPQRIRNLFDSKESASSLALFQMGIQSLTWALREVLLYW